jgi:hypothetical protein
MSKLSRTHLTPLSRKGVTSPTTVRELSGGAVAGSVPITISEDFDVLDDVVPAIWSGPHVGRRLTEAMRTLRLLPIATIAGYRAAWPAYSYEWDDLVEQAKQGELERTQQLQNRTRLLPGLVEVTRMEIAIQWPAEFLARSLHIIVAVNAVALAHALDRDSGWVAAKRGGYGDTWRARHDQGCEIIAGRLSAQRLPVF